MKEASKNRDPSAQNPTVGKAEQLAGRMTGCEGMEKEGAQAQSANGQ